MITGRQTSCCSLCGNRAPRQEPEAPAPRGEVPGPGLREAECGALGPRLPCRHGQGPRAPGPPTASFHLCTKPLPVQEAPTGPLVLPPPLSFPVTCPEPHPPRQQLLLLLTCTTSSTPRPPPHPHARSLAPHLCTSGQPICRAPAGEPARSGLSIQLAASSPWQLLKPSSPEGPARGPGPRWLVDSLTATAFQILNQGWR